MMNEPTEPQRQHDEPRPLGDQLIGGVKLMVRLCLWVAAFVVAIGFVAVSPILGIVFLPLAARVMETLRRRRGAIVLTYLEQAVRLNLPLPRMLYAAERSEKGKLARRLKGLRELLQSGVSVGMAVEEGVPEMPRRTVRLTEAGERMGRLGPTLTRLVAEDQRTVAQVGGQPPLTGAYLLMMVLVTTAVVWMVTVFVLPKYEAIFMDFGTKLPAITVFVFRTAGTLAPLLMVVVVLLAIVYLVARLWDTLGLRRDRIDAAWVWVTGVLPFVSGVTKARGWADVCQLMGDALEVGRPASEALDEAAGLRLVPPVKRRVIDWSAEVTGGRSLQEAAREARLPALITGMLEPAGGSVDAAGVFNFLARYYRTRFSRTLLLIQGAVMPATVLIMAVIVGAIALAMFTPLVALINTIVPFSKGM
jgi:type IV pilus assembly protein PilC